jgi:ATP-dependent Zn protease
LIEIVDFLKDNKQFKQMGSRIPKGVLFVSLHPRLLHQRSEHVSSGYRTF